MKAMKPDDSGAGMPAMGGGMKANALKMMSSPNLKTAKAFKFGLTAKKKKTKK